MAKKISIKDIAVACGVTTATVSRAINNQPGMRDEVRRHILEYIENIGWRSTRLSHRFATAGKGRNVLIVCNLQALSSGGTDSLQDSLRILIEKFEEAEIIPSVIYGKSVQVVESCLTSKPDIVVLFVTYPWLKAPVTQLVEAGVRVVAAYGDDLAECCPQVGCDYYAAARLAVEKLRATGCRKIGMFAGLGMLAHSGSPEKIPYLWLRKVAGALTDHCPGFDPAADLVGDCFGEHPELIRMLEADGYDGWICCGHAEEAVFHATEKRLGKRVPVIAFSPGNTGAENVSLGRFSGRSDAIGTTLFELAIAEDTPKPGEYAVPCQWHEGNFRPDR